MSATYFTHAEHAGIGYTHIVLMIIGWVFLLPVAVMLSLARSRHTVSSQLVFLAVHTLGLVAGTVYNTKTPDLYPDNAHHKLGWVATWVVAAHVFVGVFGREAPSLRRSWKGAGAGAGAMSQPDEEIQLRSFVPISTSAMAEYHRLHGSRLPKPIRHSDDSGHGTEGNTEPIGRNSISTTPGDTCIHGPSGLESGARDEFEEDEELSDDVDMPEKTASGWHRYSPSRLTGRVPDGILKASSVWYSIIDRTILVLGFTTVSTGVAIYGGFFEGDGIYSGLAHWIKGGVFFWMGILTLGRWSGSFGELGWAWNVTPRRGDRKWRPSAEFVESALIFTYGSTNIFLEHLGGWGGEWTSQDLEHISITVLFIGGGLCGMLVESTRVRDLLNMTMAEAAVTPQHMESSSHSRQEQKEKGKGCLDVPDHYRFSLNPLPALVIVLLGIMMSSHTQHSMISGMIHKQWGNLLLGASLARCLTYLLVFLKPPTSVLPSRPPTELLAAFGLIAGGIIFMASSGDTVAGMENNHLDAMFFYTVTMGMVGVLMSWVILLLALKGWAVRKESGPAEQILCAYRRGSV